MTITAGAPSWTTILSTFSTETPKLFRLPGAPELFVQVEPNADRLSLLVPWNESDPVPVSPMRELLLDKRLVHGKLSLSVSSQSPPLFHETYSFLLTVAARIQIDGLEPAEALDRELRAWSSLLQPAERMTTEGEIGLVGELWVLNRLVSSAIGRKAIESWVAGNPESHDFRLNGVDLEVKSTLMNERIHTISSPAQVMPLEGHGLFFVSLQLAPSGPGTGRTLPECISLVSAQLAGFSGQAGQLESIVTRRGYRQSDSAQYSTRYSMRAPACMVPVNTAFPSITYQSLLSVLGSDRASRVSGVKYDVKLNGLGHLDGTEEFGAIIPITGQVDLL